MFDDGVARPAVVDSRAASSKLTIGPSGLLFGFNDRSSAFDLAPYALSANGVSLLSSDQHLVSVFQNDIHYAVIDLTDPRDPYRLDCLALFPSPTL